MLESRVNLTRAYAEADAGGPRGLDLESACHEAASQLLVPSRFFHRELEDSGDVAGEDLSRCATAFDVSLEVILRRLRNHPSVQSQDLAFALCHAGKIGYTMYPPWMGSILGKPAGISVQKWFRTSDVSLLSWFRASGLEVEQLPNGCFTGISKAAVLAVRKLFVGQFAELFEIRQYPATTSKQELHATLLSEVRSKRRTKLSNLISGITAPD